MFFVADDKIGEIGQTEGKKIGDHSIADLLII